MLRSAPLPVRQRQRRDHSSPGRVPLFVNPVLAEYHAHDISGAVLGLIHRQPVPDGRWVTPVKFIPMSDLLTQASREGYAVPSFCVWNAETVETVLRTASELRAVVILMNGPGEFSQLGPHEVGAVAKAVAERFAVPAALHLDHGNS